MAVSSTRHILKMPDISKSSLVLLNEDEFSAMVGLMSDQVIWLVMRQMRDDRPSAIARASKLSYGTVRRAMNRFDQLEKSEKLATTTAARVKQRRRLEAEGCHRPRWQIDTVIKLALAGGLSLNVIGPIKELKTFARKAVC